MKITFQLAGAQFRPMQARSVIADLSPGDEVTLEAEPENTYDKWAVRIHAQNEFIGYVPKTHSQDVAGALSYNSYTAKVTVDDEFLKPWIEVEFVP